MYSKICGEGASFLNYVTIRAILISGFVQAICKGLQTL